MNKKILVLMCGMLLLSVVNVLADNYTCDYVFLYEPFNYSDGFTSHPDYAVNDWYNGNNWMYLSGCGTEPSTPIAGVFDGNAFGLNGTKPCGATGFTRQIYQLDNTLKNYTGKFIVQYNISNSAVMNSIQRFYVSYHRDNTTDASSVIFAGFGGNNNISISPSGATPTCYVNYSVTYPIEVKAVYDTDTDVVDLYVDNLLTNCRNVSIPSIKSLSSVALYHEMSASAGTISSFVDDITVCNATIYTEPEVGNYTCNDTDGGYNISMKGTVTVYDSNLSEYLSFTDYCEDNIMLREGTTVGCEEEGSITTVLYNCTALGYNACYDGACADAYMISYREDIGALDDKHHFSYYGIDNIIWYEIFATGLSPLYTAIDCDVSVPPAMSAWSLPYINTTNGTTQHYNCTYNTTGNYSVRVYYTDGTPDFGDYSRFLNDIIEIRQCVIDEDCGYGYLCGSGVCYMPSNVTNCTDTDGGLDYNVSGNVTTPWGTYSDSCYMGTNVIELYCNPSNPNGYGTSILGCSGYGTGWICYQGACTNSTNASTITINLMDFETGSLLSGISYAVAQEPSYTVVASGTVSSGYLTLSLPLGYTYQLEFTDSSGMYKDWHEFDWEPQSMNVYMEKNCLGDCLFKEYFSYADSPTHHGWSIDNLSVYYHSTYGFVGKIEDVGFESIEFTESSKRYITASYDIVLADQQPSGGQDVVVYLRDNTDEIAGELMVLRYFADDVLGSHVYYFSEQWNEIVITPVFFSTQQISVKIVMDMNINRSDIYVKTSSDTGYRLFADDVKMISNSALSVFEVYFGATPYSRVIYIDNIEILQSDILSVTGVGSSNETIDPTNPSSEDLDSPWYRDGEGKLKFDATKCSEYNSMIWCAVYKFSMAKLANGVKWIFTGVHILYFIVMLILIIIIGPLLIELFRPKK